MTYRVGACAIAVSRQSHGGILPGRDAEDRTGARPPSITPAPRRREDRAAEFWRGAVREGHLAAGGTVAELRPDLSPALAARLGIADPSRPLTQAGIANLLNATRLDGSAIAGRKKHSATRSVAEIVRSRSETAGIGGSNPERARRQARRREHAADGRRQGTAGRRSSRALASGSRRRWACRRIARQLPTKSCTWRMAGWQTDG